NRSGGDPAGATSAPATHTSPASATAATGTTTATTSATATTTSATSAAVHTAEVRGAERAAHEAGEGQGTDPETALPRREDHAQALERPKQGPRDQAGPEGKPAE